MTTDTDIPKATKHYRERRTAGYEEMKFWVQSEHRDQLRLLLKEMFTSLDHHRLFLRLLQLRIELGQEDEQTKRDAA